MHDGFKFISRGHVERQVDLGSGNVSECEVIRAALHDDTCIAPSHSTTLS
jgi:hypothetical protein